MARVALCLTALGAVTGVLYGLDRVAPALSLGALYLFAVLPVALLFGLGYAIAVSLAGMTLFNVLFLPPLYSFTLEDSENWVALALYLATAIVVSELALRARRRAVEAEQRSREQAALAEVATALLTGSVHEELAALSSRLSQLLGVRSVRVETGDDGARPGELAYELRAGREPVGRLLVAPDPARPPRIRRGFLDALASLIVVAADRERFAEEALEAEALRRSDLAKTAVLRAVSHDLQSPLTAIMTAAGMLASTEFDIELSERHALAEAIRDEAHRLERLVRDLLDLSRLEAGVAAPTRELWTVDELLAQALAEVGPEAARVAVALPEDVPSVQVDAAQIRRALANLLDNALKFGPADSPVSVRVEHCATEVVVRVVDAGSGPSPAEAERIFEPFYRAPSRRRPQGSGLGLAIVRGFAAANGGRVWLDTRPGEGCAFALALPAAQAVRALP